MSTLIFNIILVDIENCSLLIEVSIVHRASSPEILGQIRQFTVVEKERKIIYSSLRFCGTELAIMHVLKVPRNSLIVSAAADQ